MPLKLFSNDKNKKSIRIKADAGNPKEKYLTVQLTQSFDFLEFLSLKLSQKDAYRLFDSDHGVVVGRVLGNEGVGLPNCKVSIFIPISPEDSEAAGTIPTTVKDLLKGMSASLYPYETVSDSNNDGIRYNLLPINAKNRGFNGFPSNPEGVGATPKTPVGTFPDKEEVLVNPSFIEVYEKYYRFTTVTNESGDFMLYGVPTGNHILHMDCDLTDIGRWSMSPALMSTVLGYPESLFDDSGTRISPSTDLDTLPHIQSQNMPVFVKPLWSQDQENTMIGITRQDFKVLGNIVPYYNMFLSGFRQPEDTFIGDSIIFRLVIGTSSWIRIPNPASLYVDFSWDDGLDWGFREYFCLNKPSFDNTEFLTDKDYQVCGGKYDLPALGFLFDYRPFDCNAGKDGRDTQINPTSSAPDDWTDKLDLANMKTGKINVKVFTYGDNITNAKILTGGNDIDIENDIRMLRDNEYVWVQENGLAAAQVLCNRTRLVTTEDGQLVPSDDPNKGVFSEFGGYMIFDMEGDINNPPTTKRTGRVRIRIPQSNDVYNGTALNNIWATRGHIFKAGSMYSVAQFLFSDDSSGRSFEDRQGMIARTGEVIANNTLYGFPSNDSVSGINTFENEWLNFSLYFIQFMYKTKRRSQNNFVCANIIQQKQKQLKSNSDPVGGTEKNTQWMLNGYRFQTKFIEVNKEDYLRFYRKPDYGFSTEGFTSPSLAGESNGNHLYAGNGTKKFFYKGFFGDAVKYLFKKNLI